MLDAYSRVLVFTVHGNIVARTLPDGSHSRCLIILCCNECAYFTDHDVVDQCWVGNCRWLVGKPIGNCLDL